jgi:hypothetical protein
MPSNMQWSDKDMGSGSATHFSLKYASLGKLRFIMEKRDGIYEVKCSKRFKHTETKKLS